MSKFKNPCDDCNRLQQFYTDWNRLQGQIKQISTEKNRFKYICRIIYIVLK